MELDTQFGLKLETIEKIRSVFSKHPVIEKAILYGSRAMGTYKLGSDIDLTLIGAQLTLSEMLAIEGELDDLLLPYKIDLSIKGQIDNADLLAHIERVGIEFYKRS